MPPPSWTSHPIPQSPCLSSLNHRASSHWMSVLHMVVYMFPCYFSPFIHLTLSSPYPMFINLFSMCESPLWKWSESESHSVVFNSLGPLGLYSPRYSPGQNTGVGSCSLLQGIFPTQGSNPGFPLCRRILYQLSHQGSPGILEWVPYPFSSQSSWPGNQTRVSCIAGGFFTSWASKVALHCCSANRFNYFLFL